MNKKNYLVLFFITIIFLCGWAVYGGNQKSSPPKQTWEYKSFSLYRSISGNGKWEKMYEDGKDVGVNFPGTIQKLRELGEQGWELTSSVTISSAKHDGYEGYNNDGVLLKTSPSYSGFTNEVLYFLKRLK